MIGRIRMVVLTATTFATLACQGCVQSHVTYAVPSVPVHVYETQPVAPTNQRAADRLPTLTYTGTFESAEVTPHLGFEAAETYSGPIDLTTTPDLSTNRLYASSALTELASEREQDLLLSVPRETRQLTAEISLSASAAETGLGFDVGLAPRVSFTRDGAFATRRIGGEVRIGQNFDKRGDGDVAKSWYLFAGADGEALVWEPNERGYVSVSELALRDKVTVGDVQAGVALNSGLGQLSFSYIQREVEYRERNLGASENEQFVGLSFTIRN